MAPFTGALILAGAIALSGQVESRLASLTVSVARLPKGCQLEPADPAATGATRFVMWPGNPAESVGRPAPRYAPSIRQRVDGPAGPTYGLTGPALRDYLAQDVIES
jgi:hypothetical protein